MVFFSKKFTIVGLELIRKEADLIDDKLKELDNDNQKEILKSNFKAALKIWVYMAHCFLEDFDKSPNQEGEEEKVQKILNSGKKSRKKAKKGKKKITEGREGFEDSDSDDDNGVINVEKVLIGLEKTAEKRIGALWKEQLDEESYLKLYIKIVFGMLEKKETLVNTNYRNALKQILKQAMQTKIDKKGLFQLVSGKMVHMLYSIDGIDERMAELIVHAENDDLTKEVLMEVGKSLAKNDTAHETTGVKNISSFLEIVSEKAAKTLFSQLPSVIQLLNCEAYQLRNTAVAIMGNIVGHVFSSQENEEDADTRVRYDEQKMQILKLLMMRSKDQNAFSRAKAIGVMSDLIDKNLINQTLHLDFLKISCCRIKDVASNVRRKAMQLLWKEITIFSKLILKEDVFFTLAELQSSVENNKRSLENIEKTIEERKQKIEQENKNKITSEPMITEEVKKENQENNSSHELEDLNEEKQKYIATAEFYEIYQKFLLQIEEIVPCLTQLLSSKNGSDVIESIKVLTALYKRRVNSALVFFTKT